MRFKLHLQPQGVQKTLPINYQYEVVVSIKEGETSPTATYLSTNFSMKHSNEIYINQVLF